MPLLIVIGGIFSASPSKPDSYSIASITPGSDDPDKLLFTCSRQKLQILPNGHVSICAGLDDNFVNLPPIVTDTVGEKTITLREILSSGSDYMQLMSRKQGEFNSVKS